MRPLYDCFKEEKSEADEMMFDLGYKKVDLDFLFSRFWEEWENVDLKKTISFNTEHKYFKVEDENEYGITMQELEAITLKCVELRLEMKIYILMTMIWDILEKVTKL